jgi:hypothetical protein
MFLGITSSRIWPFELLAAPAVAQGDGDGALGVLLADDEAVEFRDDFAGRKCTLPWNRHPTIRPHAVQPASLKSGPDRPAPMA